MKRYSSPDEIKVGVIGYGGAFNMGRQHLKEMQRAGMKPFAVCEIDPERLAVAREDFPGIEEYATLDAMLKQSEVDLIVHITPHKLHYPLAAKCVRAGKHVVTEKPFVLTTAQADRLIRLAEENEVMVSTYHNRHWDGWILRAVEEIVEKKVIGDVYRIEAHMGGYGAPKSWWRTSKSISGGILYDWGVHLLEYSLQLIPSEIDSVTAFGVTGHWEAQAPADWPWKGDTNEDHASAIVRFRNGAFINLSISQLNAVGSRNTLEIHGTGGCYLIHFRDGWTVRKPGPDGKIVEETGDHPPSQSHRFYENVAGYLCGKEDLIITPQWARRPIHILDLADRSMRQGRTVKAKDRA